MSLPAQSEIVIVGGGAIGLGVAYSLAHGSVARVRLAMHSAATTPTTPWRADAAGRAPRLVTPRVLTPRSRGKHPSTERRRERQCRAPVASDRTRKAGTAGLPLQRNARP
jgi:glycine/D-amino acid oxidase-like deaminating enzyme